MPIAALATIVAASLAVVILLRAAAWLPVARPSARALHVRPVLRVGGLSIIAGVAAGMAWWPALPGFSPHATGVLGMALVLVAAVSLIDDWRALRARTRLAVQFIAAFSVAATFPLAIGAMFAAMLAMMWMANLVNFMDGSDGVAASAAICGFAAYAVAAHVSGAAALPFICIALACLPFLVVNAPPARMFMGDVGAVPLGFAAAALGIAGVLAGAWPAWLPLLAFITLILDATLTLAARALRGERVWQAHKLHYYQRLNQLGAGHRGTLAVYASLAFATSATALVCVVVAPRQGWRALAGWMVILVLLFAAIDYHWKRREPTP